jgi:single-strand DNA-binding protein
LAGTVNRVILIGRLGRDPEIKYTPSGQAMATFTLATDEARRDSDGNLQSQTEWHNIVLWGKQAETAGEYLKKGKLVYIEGRLQTRSWEDSQGGGTRHRTEIIGNRFVMLGGKSEGSESSPPARTSPAVPTQPSGGSHPEEEEDLPF